MAKTSGTTRVGDNSYGLSLGNGTDLPDKVVRDSSIITNAYSDFKYNKKSGYDIRDENFLFITKSGKLYADNEYESPKGMQMKNVIYIEYQNAEEKLAWYDNSKQEHKKVIQSLTGYKVK